MTVSIERLQAELAAKTAEIEKLYIERVYGSLDPAQVARVAEEREVEQLIEEAEESLVEGDTQIEWLENDARLRGSEMGRLLFERHQLQEILLDKLDDE